VKARKVNLQWSILQVPIFFTHIIFSIKGNKINVYRCMYSSRLLHSC
jgi:hypothetical protein